MIIAIDSTSTQHHVIRFKEHSTAYHRLGHLAVTIIDYYQEIKCPVPEVILEIYPTIYEAMHGEDEWYMELVRAMLGMRARDCGLDLIQMGPPERERKRSRHEQEVRPARTTSR